MGTGLGRRWVGVLMAVTLQTTNLVDPDVQEFQRNVAAAVEALSNEKASVGVLGPISASRKLVGNEGVVLVDSSTAASEITLILPGVKLLRQRLSVKVVKAGSNAVRIKAADIPGPTTPSIDYAGSIAIPAGSATGVSIVTDGLNYYTVS